MASFFSMGPYGELPSDSPGDANRTALPPSFWTPPNDSLYSHRRSLRPPSFAQQTPSSINYPSFWHRQNGNTSQHPSLNLANQNAVHTSLNTGRETGWVQPWNQRVPHPYTSPLSNTGLGVTLGPGDGRPYAGTDAEERVHAAIDYDTSSPASLQGPFTPPSSADVKVNPLAFNHGTSTSSSMYAASPHGMAPSFLYSQIDTPCPYKEQAPHFCMHDQSRPMYFGMVNPNLSARYVGELWTPTSSNFSNFDTTQSVGRIIGVDGDDLDTMQQSNPQFLGAHDISGLPISDEEDGGGSTVSAPLSDRKDECKTSARVKEETTSPMSASDSNVSDAGSRIIGLRNMTEKDRLLIKMRRQGFSYKAIKEKCGFHEAESTLRGKHRMLTKDKCERVRRPEWTKHDLELLHLAVQQLGRPRADRPQRDSPRLPWKQISVWIKEHGGSYLFAPATCARKWESIKRSNSRRS